MKILAALDDTNISLNALRTACGIARKTGAYVTALHVNKGEEYTPLEVGWLFIRDKLAEELETVGEDVIRKAYGIGRAADVTIEGVMSYGIPAKEILRYVEAHGIVKLIAMGHSTKGFGAQEFTESATKTVVNHSRIPVLVSSEARDVRRILLAVGTADSPREVAQYAGGLAKLLGADLTVVTVVPDHEAMLDEYRPIAEVPDIERHLQKSTKVLEKAAERRLVEAQEVIASMGATAEAMVRKGAPAEEVAATAARYDLVIAGTQRRESQRKLGRIARRLLECHEISTIFL